MRLIAGLAAGLAAAAACANLGNPPGGPPDTEPPVILSIRPDSGAIVPGLRDPAVIQFDEVIEEVPGMGGGGGMGMVGGAFGGSGGGAQGLASLVLLSPVRGPVQVSWHRSAIRVRPKEGWRPDRVYRLELLAGISDLRRNRTETGRTVVFSTGPALPSASLAGRAVLWVEQRALPQGLIVAALAPDTIGYLAYTDSSGAFRLDGIPAGQYVVYAIQDGNGNRRRDRREAYDSTLVTVDSSASILLWAFAHDTVGPRIQQVEFVDSLTVRLVFSQALDVTRPLARAQVEILSLPDSVPLPLDTVLTPAEYDSLLARARAVADTAGAAPDSVPAAGADTTPRAPAPAAAPAAKPPPAFGPRPAGPAPVAAAADSALRRLLAARVAPSNRRLVRVARPLLPATRFLVRVSGVANLTGAVADAQAVFESPKPPEPAPADTAQRSDSLRAPRDTTTRP